MGNLIFIYALVNLISLIPVAHAADKRVVSTGWASLVALIFSHLIGLLFILCNTTKTEKENQDRSIRMIHYLPDNIKKKLNPEE